MMGMGGADGGHRGRDAAKRRRVVAMFIICAMVMAAGATLVAILLS